MPAMRIISPFNVGENSQARLLVRTEGSAIDQFTLQGGEEALAHGVEHSSCQQTPLRDARQPPDNAFETGQVQ